MPRRKHTDAPERILVNVPESVMTQVRLILNDPFTGNLPYGALSDLVTQLLKQWLASQIRARTAQAHASTQVGKP